MDEEGRSLEIRCKLLIEITAEVRKVWPRSKILGAWVAGIDWMGGGINIEDSVCLVQSKKN